MAPRQGARVLDVGAGVTWTSARMAAMGARVVGDELARTIVDAWLKVEYQGGRSAPKVEIMRELEKESFKK